MFCCTHWLLEEACYWLDELVDLAIELLHRLAKLVRSQVLLRNSHGRRQRWDSFPDNKGCFFLDALDQKSILNNFNLSSKP